MLNFPCGSASKESACRRPGFDPWIGTIPWRREKLPTPVFWPGEFHGLYEGFLDSSVGKGSTCDAGDPGLIPGSGRSVREGIDYPPQYSWASMVVQLLKNPPAIQETLVHFLGQEDPLEKELATHSSILGLPWWLRQ